MNRIYLNTIAPKSGNYDQIHAWSIDLMFQTYLRKDSTEQHDVMHYIRREMWLAIVERRSAPYGPYVQRLINTVFFNATKHHLDQEMGDDFWLHKPLSLMIKHHEEPRSIEERIVAEAVEAEVIRVAKEAGVHPPRGARAHARARASSSTAPPPPDRKSTRLNSSHITRSRMPSSA